MTQDINLFYYGGSGGFFCLHLLLLTGQYQCVFNGAVQDFEKIFQKQWSIKDTSKWKLNEIWPDNTATATATSNIARKIYHHCSMEADWQQYSGIKIALYTDIETQWFLARSKRANWFGDALPTEQEINEEFAKKYNLVRGDNWPDCTMVRDFNSLPRAIKEECLNVFHFDQHWAVNPTHDLILTYIEIDLLNNAAWFNGDRVHKELVDNQIFAQADIIIKLQDLIKSNGDVLFSQLGLASNSQCKDFVKQWISLHTDEQLAYLLR